MKRSFWHLSSNESTRKLATWDDDKMDIEGIVCASNPGHQRGGKRLTKLSILLPNLPLDDIIWTWYSECLITEESVKFIQDAGFTGYELKPVEARFEGKSEKAVPKLWELVIFGWAGIAPPESGVKLKESCSSCGWLNYSYHTNPERLIEQSQWDGSDFFMVWPLPKYIFVTDRVKQFMRKKRFRGARFTALKDLKGRGTEFSPGRLSYFMPDARAKRLGKPLGIY